MTDQEHMFSVLRTVERMVAPYEIVQPTKDCDAYADKGFDFERFEYLVNWTPRNTFVVLTWDGAEEYIVAEYATWLDFMHDDAIRSLQVDLATQLPAVEMSKMIIVDAT